MTDKRQYNYFWNPYPLAENVRPPHLSRSAHPLEARRRLPLQVPPEARQWISFAQDSWSLHLPGIYCGWLRNPAPVESEILHQLNQLIGGNINPHCFTGFQHLSTILRVVQDFATIHSISIISHEICLLDKISHVEKGSTSFQHPQGCSNQFN